MRPISNLVLVLASAVAYGDSFPPAPHRSLAWVALVPLLVVLRRVSARAGLLLAWVWTVAMAYRVNDWFPRAVSGYFQQSAAVGIGLFLGVSTFTAAMQYMAFAATYQRLVRAPSAATPCLAAAAWVAAELMRVILFGGDPWALLGYSQVGVLPLMQVADVTGVHGITFVVALVNATLAELWYAASRRHSWRRAVAALILVLLVGLGAFGYGAVRLATGIASPADPVSVGVVQAHLDLGTQWRRSFYGRNLDTYLELSEQLLRAQPPRLLVWPESAMTFFIADEPAYRRSIASLLEPAGAELVVGGPYTTGGEPPQYFNSAFLVSPDGAIRGRYDKQQLLPFAEHFPFGEVDLLQRSFGRVREFTPGGEAGLLGSAVGAIGVVICNEGFFPEPAAARVRAGAVVLVNLANDSWLGAPKFSEPAFDMVTLRAVEQRRWIIRASTSGPSALIDPMGRVTSRTSLFDTATLAGTFEPVDTITPYCRIGDLFAWGCVAAILLAWLSTRRRANR